jgi:hypothetical protein
MITQDQILALSFPVIGAAVAVATGFLAMRIWVKPVKVTAFAASEDKPKDETEAALNKIVAELGKLSANVKLEQFDPAIVTRRVTEDANQPHGAAGQRIDPSTVGRLRKLRRNLAEAHDLTDELLAGGVTTITGPTGPARPLKE